MARPIKHGIEYFPLDVDFFDDPKLIIIEEQFGFKGLHITTRLLCMIYRNGYYLEWNNEAPLVIAKRVGCGATSTLVVEVVKALIKCGFFNKDVFDRCQILTSGGIQKRWERIIDDCKRKAVIDVSHLINSINGVLIQEETIPIQEETTQSKVKYSIVKKSKVEREGLHPARAPDFLKKIYDSFKEKIPKTFPLEWDKLHSSWAKLVNEVKTRDDRYRLHEVNPETLDQLLKKSEEDFEKRNASFEKKKDDLLRNEIIKFKNYYSPRGWKLKGGYSITEESCLDVFATWCEKKKQFT